MISSKNAGDFYCMKPIKSCKYLVIADTVEKSAAQSLYFRGSQLLCWKRKDFEILQQEPFLRKDILKSVSLHLPPSLPQDQEIKNEEFWGYLLFSC